MMHVPTFYNLKPAFQRLLRPLCTSLHAAGVTPNQITVVTLLASAGMGGWVYVGRHSMVPLVVLPLFLVLRMAANAIDGMIAREYGLCTPAGAALNEVCDVLSDTALYLPFAALPGIRPILPVAVVMLGAVTEVAGLAALSIGAARGFDGPMGKSDRAFVLGVLAVVHAAGMRNTPAWDVLLGLVLVLLVLTIVNRCRNALREAPR